MAFTDKLGGGRASGGGGYKSKVSNLRLSEKDQKKLSKMDSTEAKKFLLKKGNRADIRSALGQAAKIAIGGPTALAAGIYFGAKKLAGDKKEKIDSPKGKKSLFGVKENKTKK